MTLGVTIAYDATTANFSQLPAGQHAGYTTGAGIAWTAAQWAADPGAVRICQSNGLTDATADVADVESGAGQPSQVAGWAERTLANFKAGTRPGQRSPAVYCSQDSVTPVVNALIAGGVTSGVGLWIANWNLSEPASVAVVIAAALGGPFPLVGIQFTDTGGGGAYDTDIFALSWLSDQSGTAGDTVSEGSSGPAVLAAQQRLKVWGVSVTPDGLFGPATLAAVEAFQTAQKLAKDGVVGPLTWVALDTSPVVMPPVVKPAPPVPAPADMRQSVSSAGSTATFTWGAVAGWTAYHLQAEWYKPGFGWVLSLDEVVTGTTLNVALAARTSYRWRVGVNNDDHVWPDWVTFATS